MFPFLSFDPMPEPAKTESGIRINRREDLAQ
jgi:hypothetical protein